MASRSLAAEHLDPVASLPTPQAQRGSHARVRAFSTDARPAAPRAQWIGSASTELGHLATMSLDALSGGGFLDDSSHGLASAETAFLVLDDSTSDVPGPALPVARPRHDTAPMARPSVTPEAARAFLSQPVPAPEVDPEPVQRITIGPSKPAPRKSNPPAARSRESFVGALGAPAAARPAPAMAMAMTPAMVFAPALRTVPSAPVYPAQLQRSARALNFAAAVLSGLAAAMLVMVVLVAR